MQKVLRLAPCAATANNATKKIVKNFGFMLIFTRTSTQLSGNIACFALNDSPISLSNHLYGKSSANLKLIDKISITASKLNYFQVLIVNNLQTIDIARLLCQPNSEKNNRSYDNCGKLNEAQCDSAIDKIHKYTNLLEMNSFHVHWIIAEVK